MMKLPSLSLLWCFLLVGAPSLFADELQGEPVEPLTVVELFTSQGCYSCPPADDYLGELAKRDDIIAVACHVTYWNYIGWKDTFSRSFCDTRQRNYQSALVDGYRGVYTPQMVVNGRYAGVGSRTTLIDKIIEYDRKRQPRLLPVTVKKAPSTENNTLLISLPESASTTERQVWLLGTTGNHLLPISRGENAGKRLPYHNPIEYEQHLGTWRGQAEQRSIILPSHIPAREWVVIVQDSPVGSIIAAGKLSIDG